MADQNQAGPAPLDRRVLAIMATDVVGYSRQMEADEAGTIARVTALRAQVLDPLLERHRGRLIKLIGDGTLSVFDSVVDAVTCAAAIQRAVRQRNQDEPDAPPIVLRVAVNLGDVALLENDVYGHGVNVAARLESLCDPGGVMISGTAYDHLQGKTDLAFEFVGEQQVKNITRPVRAYRARIEGVRAPPRRRRLPIRRLAAAALTLLVAAAGWWTWSTFAVPPANASVAVLPFDNLGGDAATVRLAEGITEDVITELTRFRAIDVIARDATRHYRAREIDVRAVGNELQVRFVLDGTVQRQGERLRITTQLIETSSARDVWSDRWELTGTDLFAVQSEVAEAVASRLASPYAGPVVAVERASAKRKPPSSLSAYELYLLGMEELNRASREGYRSALARLQQSLALDPEFARAWTGMATAYSGLAEMEGYPAEMVQAREAAARKAVMLDPADAQAHAALATHFMDAGDPARAESEFDRALSLTPGSADLLAIYAGWASGFGKPERGVEAAERAMRLNPDVQPWAVYNFAYAYFMAGRYEDALWQFDRMPRETYTPSALVYRAATLGVLGQTAAASSAVAAALAQQPDLTVEAFATAYTASEADRLRIVDSMRAAGFPMCAAAAFVAAHPDLERLPECVAS
jgi:TolB-like protein/class 3 adenylate cyclase/Tfp pilus assembly protein PilF